MPCSGAQAITVVLSAQNRFWFICNHIQIENERKLVAQCRFSLICNQILIENERKLAWDGLEQILVDLQSKF